MRPNLGYYVQNINDIVQDTEKIGEEMNPHYEIIRAAIDADTLTELTPEKITEVVDVFTAGTKKYKAMLAQIEKLRPPAKVMGIHKKFQRSYEKYVAGCDEMIASLQTAQGIDTPAFNAAEEKQDEATDEISFSIQRMTNLLLGKK
ncbi:MULTISPECIES: hypothetical protein [Enterococcus]|uniref:LXG domain-containing protein n=1 Tax=Enterococcus dispar ATCC 51266 TaxID=1139219 RepID=S1P331_9ENTE|nr:hypothetical protein [Enterococcus dispar]EOT40826.1 hypothetical protein OMK_01742 [Enterococcus dispar ATCC 51266]EOW86801.1 hypothetical protein I569_02164 [Enterococcus dispar ATCC 51266]